MNVSHEAPPPAPSESAPSWSAPAPARENPWMRDSSRELLRRKLDDPFPPPDQFGRIQVWRDESPHSTAAALLIVAALALVGVLLSALNLNLGLADGPPGVAAVPIVTVTLGSSATGLADVPDAPESLQTEVVATAPDVSNVDDVADLVVAAPTGNQPLPSETPALNPDTARRAKDAVKAATEASGKLQRKPPPSRVRPTGTQGLSGVFKVAADIKSVVYVIDKSGSMAGMPLEQIKAELIYAIDQLQPDQSFSVVFFDDFAWPALSATGTLPTAGVGDSLPMFTGTRASKDKVAAWINALQGSGGTNPVPAMWLAIGQQPQLIVLMSDGEFHPTAVVEITQQNHQKRRNNGRINCVGLAEVIETLDLIRKQNGPGIYYRARTGP